MDNNKYCPQKARVQLKYWREKGETEREGEKKKEKET